ncbi:MAG: ParA family protein [Pseudomonadota bacterium]
MKPCIISIVNRKGGVGKTTLAIALADTIVSEAEQEVAIVDLDPQSSASRALLTDDDFIGQTQAEITLHTLIDDRIHKRGNDEELFRKGMVHRISGRSHVNCDLYPNSDKYWDLEAQQQSSDGGEELLRVIGEFLRELKADGKVVIVDCPPGQSISALGAIRASDLVLCPITPDRFALWGKELLSDYIQRNAKGQSPNFIVSRAKLNGGADVVNAIETLAQQPEMLKTETGNAENGVFGRLAPFSDRARVRSRIQMDTPKTLNQIYSDAGALELRNIMNALSRKIEEANG